MNVASKRGRVVMVRMIVVCAVVGGVAAPLIAERTGKVMMLFAYIYLGSAAGAVCGALLGDVWVRRHVDSQ